MLRKNVCLFAVRTAFVLSMSGSAFGASFTNTLMPQPKSVSVSDGQLALSNRLTVSTGGYLDERLSAGIQRMLSRLESQTGLQILDKKIAGDARGALIVVNVTGPGEAIQSVDEDESYGLIVSADAATLKAQTVVGALRAMETLLQLVQSDRTGWFLPAVTIQDAPRFPWRGLLIDSGRHFEPVSVMRRTLDSMAATKLNVLHWHLTEDQGFRIESRVFPGLANSGSDGFFYTQDQVREIVGYARDRGIRVVPEFDMPGHSRSWFVGYPDLASAPGPYTIRREFGVESAAMDPTRESTYKFIDNFIREMAELFPDPYMHIGGDESDGSQWKANPRIVAFMKQHDLKDTAALQTYFNQRLLGILKKNGKHMMGWDEILTPVLPRDVVVQSWRGTRSLAVAAAQGNPGVLSAPYYLNHMGSAEQYYLADPESATTELTAAQRKLILGGEACMWGEYVDERSIDSRVWPRTAAVAERLWSPKELRNVDEMYRRLDVMSVRLEALGLNHLQHEDAALRALASSDEIESLRVLASIVEPGGEDESFEGHLLISLTPLDRFSDAVLPDPPSRRTVHAAVKAYLQDPLAHERERVDLEKSFQSWMTAAQSLQKQSAESPLLAETRLRSQQMSELGKIGLSALKYVKTGEAAPAGWKESQITVLEETEKPSATVRFTVIGPLLQMVRAVKEQP
jgi:hexosaminidase